MSIQDIIAFLKELGILLPLYPLAFPDKAAKNSIIVETSGGLDSRGEIESFILTLTVRADHPSKAEKDAIEINDKLKNLTNKYIKETQVVLVKTQQKLPVFVGKDENNNFYYELNYTVLVS